MIALLRATLLVLLAALLAGCDSAALTDAELERLIAFEQLP